MVPTVSAGQLLIAAPDLHDPNFDRTVVLLLDHDGSGSLGVVVNRPTELPVAEVLAPWSGFSSAPDVVFSGGPVGVDGALALAAFDSVPAALGVRPRGWRPVIGGIGLIDLDSDPESLRGDLRALRIFAGYSGWGAGQLDSELSQGAWVVAESMPGDAFTRHPGRLWSDVLRRQPGELRFLATAPSDPSLN
jgi:putative transcriptional regulator